jgi:CheY-like chemotaxis protein
MSKKILIVEDEPDPRKYLEVLLKEHGFDTFCAEDGIQAMDKVKELEPDAILLDILMPRETGIKFYRDLSKDDEYSKIPVIVCSGATQYKPLFELNRQALPKPFAFVEKPIDKELLIEKLKEAVG